MTCTNFFKKCEKRRRIFLLRSSMRNLLTFFEVLSMWKYENQISPFLVDAFNLFENLKNYRYLFHINGVFIIVFIFTIFLSRRSEIKTSSDVFNVFHLSKYQKKKKKKRKFEMNNKMHRYIVLLIKYKNNILVFIDSE